MKPGLDPKVDYAFKKVFGSEANKPLLLDLLDAVLKPPPDKRIVAVELLNPFNDKDGADDKLSILDIKARDQRGRQYNVEMQMLAPRVYPQRVLYYWAVLHSQQLREGTPYTALQDTISISFMNGMLFPDVAAFHLHFQLREALHPDLVLTPQQSMHVVELGKFRKTAEELVDQFDVWCYYLAHGAELDTAKLPNKLLIPPVRRAMEVLEMLTQNDLERERYESRQKAQRDQISFVLDAREEGLELGRAEGEQQGLQKGEFIGQIHAYQRLLKLTLTSRDELLTLSPAELGARVEALEQQLAAIGR